MISGKDSLDGNAIDSFKKVFFFKRLVNSVRHCVYYTSFVFTELFFVNIVEWWIKKTCRWEFSTSHIMLYSLSTDVIVS